MKRKKITILFSCVGRRVSLVRLFRQAARRLGLDCRIVGTDITEHSPALQCCDGQYIVKPVFHRDYGRDVCEIIRKEKVDLMIPTVDLDLPIWARRRGQLQKEGCTILISSPKVVHICQDKRKAHDFLKASGFDTPGIFTIEEALRKEDNEYPLFLKPWDGHASRGNKVVCDREELLFYAKRIPNCMVQEYIEGQEYTVDVLVDFEGKIRCAVPRLRIATRAGEVSKGKTVKHEGIIEQSVRVVEKLGAGPGIITLQCFLNGQDRIKFIEVNPRFGGGIPLAIKAGANFPRWILQLWQGMDVKIPMTGWRDGLVMLRYDEAVWLKE